MQKFILETIIIIIVMILLSISVKFLGLEDTTIITLSLLVGKIMYNEIINKK